MSGWELEIAMSAKETIDAILKVKSGETVLIVRHILVTAAEGVLHVGA